MPGHVLNRREAHKRLTRAALEEAALELFARQGYEQTTVEEIAELAGVSVRTFFRYFASKRHVLFGDVAWQRICRLGELLAARPHDEDPLASVRLRSKWSLVMREVQEEGHPRSLGIGRDPAV